MTTYLIIGLIATTLVLGNIDYFFAQVNESLDALQKQHPHVPLYILRGVYVFVFLLFWLLWPLSVTYVLYKVFNDGP